MIPDAVDVVLVDPHGVRVGRRPLLLLSRTCSRISTSASWSCRGWLSWLMPRTVVELLIVLDMLLVPKLLPEWVRHWAGLRRWHG